MATSGEIVEILTEELGMTRGAVQLYGQALRDAGMLTKGGRGLSAASMSIEDVTNWLLALCCSETAAAAPQEVKLTRDTPLAKMTSALPGDISRLAVSKAPTAGQAIEFLIDDIIEGRLKEWQEQFNPPPQNSESWRLGIIRPTATVEFTVSGQHVEILFAKPTDSGKVRRTPLEFSRTDPMFKMRTRTVTDWKSRRALGSLTRINRVGLRMFERLAGAVGVSLRDDEALARLASDK